MTFGREGDSNFEGKPMKQIYDASTSWKKASVKKPISPERFFSKFYWLDGRPLMIEPYRMDIFNRALYEFDADGRRVHNLVVTGRGKKNYKTFDRILAAIYNLLAWRTAAGNDCYLLDNDVGQSADALDLAKKFIEANSILKGALVIKQNVIERRDRKGFLKILPAEDTVGSHGKTYLFCGFGEIHGYRNWDILESMQLDPHRTDALMWVESFSLSSPRCAALRLGPARFCRQGQAHAFFLVQREQVHGSEFCRVAGRREGESVHVVLGERRLPGAAKEQTAESPVPSAPSQHRWTTRGRGILRAADRPGDRARRAHSSAYARSKLFLFLRRQRRHK
jgi:hypothetical protein